IIINEVEVLVKPGPVHPPGEITDPGIIPPIVIDHHERLHIKLPELGETMIVLSVAGVESNKQIDHNPLRVNTDINHLLDATKNRLLSLNEIPCEIIFSGREMRII
ncbi:unnamed protein product, partial [marine sediment metagenome]